MQKGAFFSLVYYAERLGEGPVEAQVNEDSRGLFYTLAVDDGHGPIYLETQRGKIREFRSLDTLYKLLRDNYVYTFTTNLGPAHGPIESNR